MKIRTEKVIDLDEWDELVKKTYERPYSLQQQDGCKERGLVSISVPDGTWDFTNDTVSETNENEMGVSFSAWLARDPNQKLSDPENQEYDWQLTMWWERNFYPDVQMVANDLYEKGLLEAGDYIIEIDW